jgi:hypothetical protein
MSTKSIFPFAFFYDILNLSPATAGLPQLVPDLGK